MACNNCTQTTTSNCVDCQQVVVTLPNCSGCSETHNTDCITYKGVRLSYEDVTVQDNSVRTLSTLLHDLESLNCCTKESKIITEAYTILEEDTNKILILKGAFDDVIGGTQTTILTLPIDLAFAGKTLTFKDITGVGTGGRVMSWIFDSDIQYQWAPAVLTTAALATLMPYQRVLRLTFVKVDAVNYAWIVI